MGMYAHVKSTSPDWNGIITTDNFKGQVAEAKESLKVWGTARVAATRTQQWGSLDHHG